MHYESLTIALAPARWFEVHVLWCRSRVLDTYVCELRKAKVCKPLHALSRAATPGNTASDHRLTSRWEGLTTLHPPCTLWHLLHVWWATPQAIPPLVAFAGLSAPIALCC